MMKKMRLIYSYDDANNVGDNSSDDNNDEN